MIRTIRFLGIITSLLPIAFFFIFRKKNKEKKLWVILFYTILSLLTDLLIKLAAHYGLGFELFSFFTLAEYSMLSYFFYLTYRAPQFKRVLLICYILFLIISAFNIAYFRNTAFDSLPTSAEAIFVVLLTILYFYEQINDTQVTFVYGSKTFWIIIAFLLYLSANLFYFIALFFLSLEEAYALNWINGSSSIVKNICIAIAFIYTEQEGGEKILRKII